MLNEKYNEYNVLQEQRLLMELLGVDSQKEVYNLIQEDMKNFTLYVEANTASFLENQSAAYLAFNSSFNSFLEEYKLNLEQLQSLNEKELALLDVNAYLGLNDSNMANGGGSGNQNFIGEHDWSTDTTDYHALALDSTSYAEIQEWLDRRTQKAEAQGIDISGSANGGYKSNDEIYKDWIDATGGEYTKSGFRKNGIEGEGFYGQNEKGEWGYFNDYAKTDPIEGTFADGILGGPVTYTGLTMLHGTPSEPEYVLNNDQAYNLLRYMATKKMPAFDSTNGDKSGIQYIVEGDIVLEGVDNPQEFWSEVTKAMGNRWNVTKNR